MSQEQRTVVYREVLRAYLSGEIDEETRPELFDEDVLSRAVAHVSRADGPWLFAALHDPAYEQERRALVARLAEAYGPSNSAD